MAEENVKQKKEITIIIKKPELIVLLAFALFALILELNVTLKTPIVFGDEGFHTRLAQLIAQDKEYFVNYPFEKTTLIQGAYSRPPLWNLLEAGIFSIFGFNETIVRVLTPFIAVMTGIAVFLLTKRILDEKTALFASIITITVPSFVTYSVLFYTDMLLSFYIALSVLLVVISLKTNSRKYLYLAATFASLAFLTKTQGLATIVFFATGFLYEILSNKKYSTVLKKYIPIFLVMILIVSGFLVRNYMYFKAPICYRIPIIGSLNLYNLDGCGKNNVVSSSSFATRTLSTGTEGSVYSVGLSSYLNFAFGNLWFVVYASVAGLLFLILKNDKSINIMLLYMMFLMLLFPFIAERAEDTARHSLSWVFLIGIISASFFSEVYRTIKKYNKYIAITVFIVVMILSYQNLSTKLATMEQVKQFSPFFFQACDWVNQNLPQNITLYTVWDHRAIYNCQRNAIAQGAVPDIALSNDINVSLKAAKENNIDYIFIQKFSIDSQNRNIGEMYNLNFINFLENNNKTFTKVYENGPDMQQCLQQGGCDGSLIYRINI